MSEQLWSVEIVIGETELAAMDYAGTRVVGPDNYIVVNPAVDGSIPATIHIDVRAPNPGQAESEALQLYREIRERAQLPADEPSVLTVSRVVGVPHRADLWIFTAMDMLDQRRFGLAVIAAQVHLEMTVRAVVDALSEAAGPKIAALAKLPRSWSLMDPASRNVFEVLTGVRVTSADAWSAYTEHVSRRNSVAHSGGEVTEQGAHQSVDAVVDLVRFIEQAERTAAASDED